MLTTYLLTTRFERHKHNNQLIQAVGQSVKEKSIIVIIQLHIANFSEICLCSSCLKDEISVAMYWIFKSPNFDITLNVPISVGLNYPSKLFANSYSFCPIGIYNITLIENTH